MTNIETRAAQPSDFPILRHIFCQAWQRGAQDEAPMWDHISTADPSFRPEYVRVALHQGEPVACTVLVPRQVRGRLGYVPGAIVTLVACRPDLQRQGYGSAAVKDALRYMTEHGMAVGVLYGEEHYYPRFGFAPVLPRYETVVLHGTPGENLTEATLDDLPRLTELYAAQCGTSPCTVARTPDPWIWQVRNPECYRLVVLPDRSAYAFIAFGPNSKQLEVREAGAPDATTARRLLAALWREAADRGREQLRLEMAPDHLLVQVAAATSLVQQKQHSARWGMAAVTDFAPLLPEGYGVTDEGLTYQGDLVLEAPRAELVQLVLGYRSARDLGLAGRTGRNWQRLNQDFPRAYPRWSEAPYWFWFAG